MEYGNLIAVRGGGDLASGVIHKLYKSGYRLLILESEKPSAIRRMVSFSEAVYDGEAFVEGVLSHKAESLKDCEDIWNAGEIPLMVDSTGEILKECKPRVVIDAVIAKKNLGTGKEMADLTIALGPGFEAGEDVDFVVETMRGHDLGRIIEEGTALPNTGIPGMVGGVGKERVIHPPETGVIRCEAKIADLVEEGQILAYVGECPVYATVTGVLRGIIRDGYSVTKGMKIADIDPRKEERQNCYSISDKARCIAGSVLEILLSQGVLPDDRNKKLS